MKRIVLLWLAALMVFSLVACGKTQVDTPTTQPTEPTTEPTTQPTEPEILYRNPLNGEPLDEPYAGRPTAVVINNLRDALPHYGTADADFLFELETESDITRMLAVYDDVSPIGQIGPVRSDRTFFNNIACSFDAAIVHCGGSVRGRNGGYEDSSAKVPNWAHLDATYYEGSYFYRDNDRYKNQGYNWEHCLFTNGEMIKAGLDKLEISAATDRSTDFGLQYDEEPGLSGAAATQVTVVFNGGKTTSFTYDAENKCYNTAQYGTDYIDANSGEIVTFRNVMVLYTDQWKRSDGEYPRSYYTLFGEGEGLLAIDGKIVAIKWSREALDTNFVFTLADGTPVTLGVGSTYVAFTPNTETEYE